MLLLYPGINESLSPVPLLTLNTNLPFTFSTDLNYSALTLIVQPINCKGEKAIFDFPTRESDPIVYFNNNPEFLIKFELFPTYGAHKKALGRAITHIQPPDTTKFWQKGGSRQVTVPLLSDDCLIVGKINFEFTVITPFSHSKLSIGSKHTYWKSVETKVRMSYSQH